MSVDLGMVRPGKTIYIPFATYDSNDPSASVTLTGLATSDIEVYKDGGTTQRASDSGYALLDSDGIDFDSTTGIHGFSINLADNSTANFWEAGSTYWVIVASITVDAATINFIAAKFEIGYPDAVLNTTAASFPTQATFTLEEGPADNDALNGFGVIVHDLASSIQIAHGIVSDYTGSTKLVTLRADPGIFTMAAGDNVSFFVPTITPTTQASIDAIEADTNEIQGDLANGGRLDLLIDGILEDTGTTIPATLNTIDGIVDDILVDTGTSVPALIATAQSDLDKLTGSDGATLATSQGNYAPALASVLGAAVGASISADLAAVKAETVLIVADTGTTLDTKLNNIQGGSFSSSTDSLEAIRNRGDAAWTSGAGGSDRLLMVDTTIASLTNQTSFTLTAGSADNNAYLNCTAVIEDASTATQKAIGLISAYTGSSKTVTLRYDPAVFTMATSDKIYILAENALKSTAQNRQLDVTATGEAGLDLDNVSGALGTSQFDTGFLTSALIAADAIGSSELATTAVEEIRNAVTGGAYDLDTDSNGRIRIVDGTGAGEIDSSSGRMQLLSATQDSIDAIEGDTNALQQDWVNGGRLDLIIDAIYEDTGTTLDGIVDAILVDTETTIPALIATAQSDLDKLTGSDGATLATAQGNYAPALASVLGAADGASVSADIAAVKSDTALTLADTNELQVAWTDNGRLDQIVDDILVDTAQIGSAGAGLTAIMTTQMTESYNADGAAPTPAQALHVIMQGVTEFAIASTTKTVKKLDGSTTAYTETLNSATTPTSITRTG